MNQRVNQRVRKALQATSSIEYCCSDGRNTASNDNSSLCAVVFSCAVMTNSTRLINPCLGRRLTFTPCSRGSCRSIAWRTATQGGVALFRSLGDARTAERADDLMDLERQVLVELSGEDHWLSRPETRQRMLEETVRFLETNNPPDASR